MVELPIVTRAVLLNPVEMIVSWAIVSPTFAGTKAEAALGLSCTSPVISLITPVCANTLTAAKSIASKKTIFFILIPPNQYSLI
jgi:hypothetical protein